MGVAKERRPVLAPSFNTGGVELKTVEIALTVAEVKALRASPKTIAPAPGTGKASLLIGGSVIYDYAAVLTETADNLVFRYTNGSGAACSDVVETTGFIDQTSDQMRTVVPVKDVAIASNAAIVLHNNGDGEFGGTGSPLRVVLTYLVYKTGL